MDSQQLDLCLSCGAHVADFGAAYCSKRCQAQDHLTPYASSSSSHRAASSSSSSSGSSYDSSFLLSPSSSSQHLPSPTYHSTYHSPLWCPDPKIASVSEWAKGVWGPSSTSTGTTSRTPTTATKRRSPPASIASSDSASVRTPCSVKSSSSSMHFGCAGVVDPWLSSPREMSAMPAMYEKMQPPTKTGGGARGRQMVRV